MVQYFSTVRGASNSWFKRFLDPRPIVLKNKQEKVYVFKELNINVKITAISELQKIITESNEKLGENPTLGVRGATPIPNPIKYDTIKYEIKDAESIDWVETTRIQTGIVNPTLEEIDKVRNAHKTKEIWKKFK